MGALPSKIGYAKGDATNKPTTRVTVRASQHQKGTKIFPRYLCATCFVTSKTHDRHLLFTRRDRGEGGNSPYELKAILANSTVKSVCVHHNIMAMANGCPPAAFVILKCQEQLRPCVYLHTKNGRQLTFSISGNSCES